MLIGIKDIMVLLSIGRPRAERILSRYLGGKRKKGEHTLVSKEHFMAWVEGGMR